MPGRILSGIKRFILWDYPRASWQYDVMVGLILAFLFITPREWFRDQPRIPRASKIAMLPGTQGADVFWVEAELLTPVPEGLRDRRMRELLKSQTGTSYKDVRLDPVFDSEEEAKGYMVYAKP